MHDFFKSERGRKRFHAVNTSPRLKGTEFRCAVCEASKVDVSRKKLSGQVLASSKKNSFCVVRARGQPNANAQTSQSDQVIKVNRQFRSGALPVKLSNKASRLARQTLKLRDFSLRPNE